MFFLLYLEQEKIPRATQGKNWFLFALILMDSWNIQGGKRNPLCTKIAVCVCIFTALETIHLLCLLYTDWPLMLGPGMNHRKKKICGLLKKYCGGQHASLYGWLKQPTDTAERTGVSWALKNSHMLLKLKEILHVLLAVYGLCHILEYFWFHHVKGSTTRSSQGFQLANIV